MSQELLGRWLGIAQAQVSKLENGRPKQNLEALRAIAQKLHLPQHLLWFDLPEQSRLTPPPVRTTDDTAADVFGTMTIGDLGDVKCAASGYGEVPTCASLLANYEHLTDNYRQIDYQAGSQAIYADTVTHLRRLMAASDQVPSSLYARYVGLLGDTAQLATWLAIDRQDYTAARHLCSIALSSSVENEDLAMHSYVLGVMSYVHLHAKRGNEALRLLDSGLRIANTPRFGVSHAIRSWLYQASAEAYAFAGDMEAGAKALATAERLFDTVRVDDIPAWLGFYNTQDHANRLRGRGLLRLSDGRAAIATLENACESLPEHFVRERSGAMIDLSAAHLLSAGNAKPEPEAAAVTAQEAWRLAVMTRSKRNQYRVIELLPSFNPYAHLNAVQYLTSMIDTSV
ncbi:helix-turn-helix transcriptional regulator [Actinokineospora sp. NBRC 105648]|uniref:helix-turn-helix domain-containing protein n=1 Tax=Actinokineospora sp. NBRC 105648 TaxID=3032206 RepID=UPI002557639E|nr:helix-turn-helix transcriptional regulator [Actinokineospora sp. NBRC 105648]